MRIRFGSKSWLFAICVFLIACCNGGSQLDNATKGDAASVNQSGSTIQAPLDASSIIGKVSPHIGQKLVDTLVVRDPQATYQPGDSSIVHAHLDLLFIY